MSPGIKEKDYRYTLEIQNEKWDVYYFVKDGKKGTLAFTKRDGHFIIGLMKKGNLSETQAAEALKLNYS
jgi:hypothetical protein